MENANEKLVELVEFLRPRLEYIQKCASGKDGEVLIDMAVDEACCCMLEKIDEVVPSGKKVASGGKYTPEVWPSDETRGKFVNIITEKVKPAAEKEFRNMLVSFWNLAESFGTRNGIIEGYGMAKAGKPLGQPAHVN